MIRSSLNGQEKDLENENDDSLCVDGLPHEVSCKLEVFSIHNEDLPGDDNNNVTTMMTMLRLLLHLNQRKQRKENHIEQRNGTKYI